MWQQNSGKMIRMRKVVPAAVLLSFLKKIAILYGISVVLYLPVGMYAGHYKQITVTGIFLHAGI